ncbi:MAG: hypothetical protein ACXWMY_19600, partial [Vulcanimicrobiaceae bacterium]
HTREAAQDSDIVLLKDDGERGQNDQIRDTETSLATPLRSPSAACFLLGARAVTSSAGAACSPR